jgi:hypothetical protein
MEKERVAVNGELANNAGGSGHALFYGIIPVYTWKG